MSQPEHVLAVDVQPEHVLAVDVQPEHVLAVDVLPEHVLAVDVQPEDVLAIGVLAVDLGTPEIDRAFSTAQTRSIIAVSATPGTATVGVVNTWNETGNFYVRVAAGGAFDTSTPFTLTITKGPTTCNGVTDILLTPRSKLADRDSRR